MNSEIFVDVSKNENKNYSYDEEELRDFKDVVTKEKINCRMDDIFLLSFLRARKFDRDRALKLLKNYCSIRERNPEIFREYNPLSVKSYLDMKMMGYLRHSDQHGRIVGIAKCPKWDPSKTHLKTIVKCTLMFTDMGLTQHIFQVNGLVLLLDSETLSWGHVLQLTPSTIYSVVSLLFGSNPISFKEIHFLNIGRFFYAFFTTFLPFLPSKIKKRFHLHSSGMESLHKFIDPKCLPADFGGELPPFDPTECNEKLLEYQEFFEKSEKYWSKTK